MWVERGFHGKRGVVIKMNEEKYVDYDEDTNCYGIFAVERDFCFALFTDEKTAKQYMKDAYGQDC